MGLCASKEQPYKKKGAEKPPTNKTKQKVEAPKNPIVDGNDTDNHNTRNPNLHENESNEGSVYNKSNENSRSKITEAVNSGNNSDHVNFQKNPDVSSSNDGASIPKKYNINNANVKMSTSKLMKEDLFQQGPNKSVLSMSGTRDLTKIQSPLANLQDTSNKEDTYKVLLLGVGESGKSTVLKQFKILRQGGYTDKELHEMRPVIYKNLMDIASDIIKARDKYKIPISESDIKDLASIKDVDEFRNTLTLSIDNRKDYIKKEGPLEDIEVDDIIALPSIFFAYLAILWKTSATQALLKSKHRNSFHLLGNAQYFIDSLERISNPNYVPTVDDVLKARLKTTGIQETVVEMKDEHITLNICDVGGQRVERKKWIHCFSNVSILIFCVSLSDYDSPLEEDPKVNGLTESIQLFDSIVNSKWFVNTQVMLFLNKIDIFLKKLPKSPLSTYFPGYQGDPKDAKASVKYILSLLKEKNTSNLTIYPHVTQATDSSNIELIFATLAETVLENRIKNLGAI